MLLGFAEGLQVDAELLALLIEMTALQAEGARDIGHVEIVAANFTEQDFTFEGFRALQKCSLPRIRAAAGISRFSTWDHEPYIFRANRVFCGQKHQSLHDVPQFAH